MAIDRIKIGIKITEFNRAASSFRSAFAPAQGKIYIAIRNGDTNIFNFFDSEFLVHAAAVEKFRPFASDGRYYQEAWDDYRKTIYDDQFLTSKERWTSNITADDTGEYETVFLEIINDKINNLLHFASNN